MAFELLFFMVLTLCPNLIENLVKMWRKNAIIVKNRVFAIFGIIED